MNFRGGCCIARYGGGGGSGDGGSGGGVYDMSKVDRIMLRYRPIAPRPESGGSSSPPVDSVSPKSRRGKRKFSKENSSRSGGGGGGGSVNSNGNSKRCNRRRKEESKNGSEIVTLPLLPETPERKEPPRVLAAAPELWLSFGDDGHYQTAKKSSDLNSELVTAKTETVVSSLLTVECVTDGEYELGCTNEERRMNLERDTCPGFISDGLGRVIWTNGSYRELVVGKDQEKSSKMSAWLVMKEKPLLTQRTFTCRIRLQYTCHDKEVRSITSPCDVWRMNDGGFAWRLDVNAALCLGR